jgi:hypothetical protein
MVTGLLLLVFDLDLRWCFLVVHQYWFIDGSGRGRSGVLRSETWSTAASRSFCGWQSVLAWLCVGHGGWWVGKEIIIHRQGWGALLWISLPHGLGMLLL